MNEVKGETKGRKIASARRFLRTSGFGSKAVSLVTALTLVVGLCPSSAFAEENADAKSAVLAAPETVEAPDAPEAGQLGGKSSDTEKGESKKPDSVSFSTIEGAANVSDMEIESLDGSEAKLEKLGAGKPCVIVAGRSSDGDMNGILASLERILSNNERAGVRGIVLCEETADQESFVERYREEDGVGLIYAADDGSYRSQLREACEKSGFEGFTEHVRFAVFLVDGDGMIDAVALGTVAEEALAEELDKLLAEENVRTDGANEDGGVGSACESEPVQDEPAAEGSEDYSVNSTGNPASPSKTDSTQDPNAVEIEKSDEGDEVPEDEAAVRAGTVTVGNYTYKLNDDNKSVTLSGYVKNPAGDIVIPSSVKIAGRTYSVTEIWMGAFQFCKNLTGVVIPDSVKKIRSKAFSDCPSLHNVVLPTKGCELGGGCFSWCDSLTSITIPQGLSGGSQFESPFGGSGLAQVSFQKDVTSVPTALFRSCKKLTSITLPPTITSIEDYAFSNSGITSIVLPNSVKTIGNGAFMNVTSKGPLKSIVIPDSVTTIGFKAFYGCSVLTNVSFGKGVTTISSSAFHGCTSLKDVNLPESVKEIGTSAFSWCSSLEKLYIPPAVTDIGYDLAPDSTIIQGYSGSYAETYAKKNSYFFESLGTVKANLNDVSIAKIAAQPYTGKAVKPAIKVTFKGKTLKQGSDYTISYANNVKKGTASVTVAGKGSYTGTKKATFAIVASLSRLSGDTALDTMASITKRGFASGSCRTVVVATTDGYWDALTASSLAGLNGCPILLTDKGSLSKQTASEIKRLKASTVYIAGGPAAISRGVESSLSKLSGVKSVRRLAGSTAIDTALEIYKQGKGSWGKTAVIATSASFQDALSVSPYAYAKRAPIFLASASTHKLDPQVVSAIKKGGFTRVVIVGGTAAISSQVEKQLSGISSKRLAGATAYETSASVANWCVSQGMKADNVGVATGGSYYDALAGAALCGKNNAALVLVAGGYTATIDSFIKPKKASISRAYVFGGPAAVSASTYKAIESALK